MTTQAQVQGLGQFARFGFTLWHPDDHTVVLLHEGRSIAIFSQQGATEKSLQDECVFHLAKLHGWNGCIWSRKNETES